MLSEGDIKERLKAFIQQEFASDNEAVADDYQLMEHGLLDSIGSLRVVSFVETEFTIRFQPHEITPEHLGSINALTRFILNKSAHAKA